MAATLGLVLDCKDPQRLAEFWTAALGYCNAGVAGSYVVLVAPDGDSPKLLLQAVTEPKATKNRMHFDIETPHVDAEVARLEALGALRLEADVRHEHGTTWVVLADPEGNEFCVCDGGSGSTGPRR
jgi:predicted enzyme related to lactoylglutathione lyase